MDSSTLRRRRFGRPLAAAVAATALALGGVVAAAPAHAAQTTITDAVFRWGINNESNSAAFAPGTFNSLSAGIVTAASTSDRITSTNWKQSEGNVKVLKRQADGTYAAATFAGLSTDANGTTITTGNGLSSGHVVELSAGTGTVDPAAGTAEIQWTGSFTSAFYSGMTRSWITDPHLSVAANGVGTVTATLGGYQTSMDDPTLFAPIAPATNVVVATLTGVQVTATGFTVTPDYLGKTVSTSSGTPQVTSGTNAGAFPQSFVDFHRATGQQGYWVTTGGVRDAAKPATPVYVSYDTSAPVAVPVPESDAPAAAAVPSNPLRAAPPVSIASAVAALPGIPATTPLTTQPQREGLVPGASGRVPPIVTPLLVSATALSAAIVSVLSMMRAFPWQRRSL